MEHQLTLLNDVSTKQLNDFHQFHLLNFSLDCSAWRSYDYKNSQIFAMALQVAATFEAIVAADKYEGHKAIQRKSIPSTVYCRKNLCNHGRYTCHLLGWT
jgi:hypothetical protein